MKTKLLFSGLSIIVLVSLIISGCTQQSAPPPSASIQSPSASAKVYEWKLESFCPAAMERYTVDDAEFARLVKEYTKGRIIITNYPANAIVPVPDVPSALRDNVIQMSHYVGAYLAGLIPVANVEFSMPMAYDTVEDAKAVMVDRGMQDVIAKAYAEKGIYYLGYQSPMGNRLIATKPFKTLNDLKGVKVRAVGTLATFCQKLGMSPVNIPMTEVYMGLSLGTVGAAVAGMDVHYDQKEYEVAKYLLASPKMSFAEPLSMLVSLKAWNELPDDLKAALKKAVLDWGQWSATQIEPKRIKAVEDGFKANGVEMVQMSPEDTAKMRVSAVEIWDEWAKTDDYCAQAVAILKKFTLEKNK